MKRFKLSLLAVLMLCFIVGCATTSTQVSSPKQTALYFLDQYNSAYDDTLTMANNPSITASQKELVIKKKAILKQMWPLLKTYTSVVNGGGIPSPKDEATIYGLINQLTNLATGGK